MKNKKIIKKFLLIFLMFVFLLTSCVNNRKTMGIGEIFSALKQNEVMSLELETEIIRYFEGNWYADKILGMEVQTVYEPVSGEDIKSMTDEEVEAYLNPLETAILPNEIVFGSDSASFFDLSGQIEKFDLEEIEMRYDPQLFHGTMYGSTSLHGENLLSFNMYSQVIILEVGNFSIYAYEDGTTYLLIRPDYILETDNKNDGLSIIFNISQ